MWPRDAPVAGSGAPELPGRGAARRRVVPHAPVPPIDPAAGRRDVSFIGDQVARGSAATAVDPPGRPPRGTPRDPACGKHAVLLSRVDVGGRLRSPRATSPRGAGRRAPRRAAGRP